MFYWRDKKKISMKTKLWSYARHVMKEQGVPMHKTRKEWVSGKYFSYFSTKIYVVGTH